MNAVRVVMGLLGVVAASACSGGPESAPSTGSVALEGTAGAVLDGNSFVAYFGSSDFDLDAARSPDPRIHFVGIQGPLSALDGKQVVVDLTTGEPWGILFNHLYLAGETGEEVMWHVMQLDAGSPGLSGQLTVRGLAESTGSVEALYSINYAGMYPLPGTGKDEVAVRLSISNTGTSRADFTE
jgi:hypothetical protein